MANVARFIKDLATTGIYQGDARLYQLDEPITVGYQDFDGEVYETCFVAVSANYTFDRGPETMVFGAFEDGAPISGQSFGQCHGYNFEKALEQGGFEVE